MRDNVFLYVSVFDFGLRSILNSDGFRSKASECMNYSSSGRECAFSIREVDGEVGFGPVSRGEESSVNIRRVVGTPDMGVFDYGFFHTHVVDPDSSVPLNRVGVDPLEFYRLPTIPEDLDFIDDLPEGIVCVGIPGDSSVYCYLSRGNVSRGDIRRWRDEVGRFRDFWGDVEEDKIPEYLEWKRDIIDEHYDLLKINLD